MSVSKSIMLAGLFAAAPMLASGEEASLTPANITLATEACANGAAPVPELSDFGHETGLYAVPIADEQGTIYTAVMMSAEQMSDIQVCARKLDLQRTQWANSANPDITR